MQFELKSASQTLGDLKLKMSIQGISGAGKTFTGLSILHGFGGKIACIDTERGKSALYSKLFPFDIVSLKDHTPNNYIMLIKQIEDAGYTSLLIDSFSHAWMGKNGMLDQKDMAVARSNNKLNDFTAWSKVTPMANHLMDVILDCDLHVIATMRTKKEYLIDRDDKNKQRIQVVGTTAIQKGEVEYEFDINAEMDMEHDMHMLKTRFLNMTETFYKRPGVEFAKIIKEIITHPVTVIDTPASAIQPISAVEVKLQQEMNAVPVEEFLPKESYLQIYNNAKALGWEDGALKNLFLDMGIESFGKIPVSMKEKVEFAIQSPEVVPFPEGM